MTHGRLEAILPPRWGTSPALLPNGLVPGAATPRVMATVGSLFYLTGALVAALVAAAHQVCGAVAWAEWMIAAGAGAAGVAVYVAWTRVPLKLFHVMNLVGTTLVTTLVFAAGGGQGSEVIAILFVYVPLDCYFFFPLIPASLYQLYGTICICASAASGLIPSEEAAALVLVSSVIAFVIVWLGRTATTAETDTLTGLPNESGLRRAAREVLIAVRGGEPASIAFFEVDGFEAVEARLGIRHGDELLQRIGQSLAGRSPAAATVARYFGEGFAVLLPGVGALEALTVCQSLTEGLDDEHTLSGGIAELESTETVSMVIFRARSALYEARQGGRGRLRVHRSDHRERAELATAIAEDQLTVLYQPIVALNGGGLLGAEALVRWDHPTRGRIGPDAFIPLAEKSDLIGDLGLHVMSAACSEAAGWPPNLKVTVNASIRELNRPDYFEQVRDILKESALAAGRLVVEVTESMVETDSMTILTNLSSLREMGVRIALDDFGTGYSSLSRLDRLPIDIVKLDRSFVASISDDTWEVPLVAAVCALAAASGILILAEGIETSHHLAVLSAHGCHEGQGYLFGRPAPARELLERAAAESDALVAEPS